MSEVTVDRRGGVATLTLAAPERRNALTATMARSLIAACDDIDHDSRVGAVVVRGEGGHFCAGAHRDLLERVSADPAGDTAYTELDAVYRAFVRVGELRAPTIAAVRGAAVGAGVNLALATDLRIVAADARFIAGFLRIGIHPGGGHFTLSARLAGREATAATAIFGEEVDGGRAVQLGMAWEAVADAEVEDRALELARRAASDPELARLAIRMFRIEAGPPAVAWPAALETERGVQMWSLRRKYAETVPKSSGANRIV